MNRNNRNCEEKIPFEKNLKASRSASSSNYKSFQGNRELSSFFSKDRISNIRDNKLNNTFGYENDEVLFTKEKEESFLKNCEKLSEKYFQDHKYLKKVLESYGYNKENLVFPTKATCSKKPEFNSTYYSAQTIDMRIPSSCTRTNLNVRYFLI